MKVNERLGAALEKREWSQTDFGRRLGVDRSAVSRWLSGGSRPDAHHRLGIELLLGINQNDWLTREERKLVDAATKTEAA